MTIKSYTNYNKYCEYLMKKNFSVVFIGITFNRIVKLTKIVPIKMLNVYLCHSLISIVYFLIINPTLTHYTSIESYDPFYKGIKWICVFMLRKLNVIVLLRILYTLTLFLC